VDHSEHIVSPVSPSAQPPASTRSDSSASTLRISLGLFAALDIGLALFMALAPHAFYTAIGPFGVSNSHYVRDVATFYAAIGLAMAVAVSRPSWRAPVLAVSTLQFALHSLNHLIDIARAHPAWAGYLDFFSLLAGTVILGRLWHLAEGAERGAASASPATPLPTPQRSPT
jgi:hypothetical protein